MIILGDNIHLEFSTYHFTFEKKNLHYLYMHTIILRTVNDMNNKWIIVLLF